MPSISEVINIGFSLHQQGDLEEAENAYFEALDLDKNNAEVYNLIGVLKLQKGEVESAIDYAQKAISISKEGYFFETLFQAYIRNSDYKKITEYESTVKELFSDDFSLLFNLALAFKNLKENKKAIKYYEKALKINPSSYQGWFNLAHLYGIEAETKNAVSAFKICNKIKPHDPEIEYFLGTALMRTKDYKHGLKYFENRIARIAAIAAQSRSYPNKLREDNLWRGENIKNKTLLVYYEAGFGDVIMFSRYLPIVRKLCKKLILICQKPLSPLFASNKQLGIDEIIDTFVPESNIDFDVHIPLLSLPYALGLKNDDVFAFSGGYLYAENGLKDEYKSKYFNNDKIKIGIKWQGNTYTETDRVIPAEKFNELTDIKNTEFYSLQTFAGSEKAFCLSNITDIGKDLIDFAQTAAVISNIDLVICNDTSLAHLAGAMGVPCWVILPYDVNWRWHTDLSKCDWYTNVRLFRQKSFGDWDSVFAEIKDEINKALSTP